jgi:signal transduction histidine kinase
MTHDLAGPDALDTRIVLRTYATLAGLAGLFVWIRPAGLSTTIVNGAGARDLALQLIGALLVGWGCVAGGLALIEEPRSRHRALGGFAVAHAVILAGVLASLERQGGLHPHEVGFPLLLVTTMLLFYFWLTGDGYRPGNAVEFTGLFRQRTTDASLRSDYVEQIRHAASQEERHRLARDLHDSVKQQIFAMQTAAATVQARLESDPPGVREAIERLRESGREAMGEMEAMLDSLRSSPLENVGLVEALKNQAEALQFRTGARVDLELADLPPSEALPPGGQEAIFRVAQEAFANVAKHARASRVQVRLAGEHDRLVLRIEDEGAGFDQAAPSFGMGLVNMRERASAFGADLEVHSRPGGGTRVLLAMPYTSWTRTDPRPYRNDAIAFALMAAAFAGGTVVNAVKGGSQLDSMLSAAICLANLVILLRVSKQYFAAKDRVEASPWLQSRSRS